jgi:hypothetical protein
MARHRRRQSRKRNTNPDRLALLGPAAGPMGRCPSQPPKYLSNLVVRKCFRFVSTGGADGTAYTISPAKLCSLIVIAITTTSVIQIFEAVQVVSIRMWSSADQSSGVFLPRTVSAEFSGTAPGIYGPQAKASDMSVGSTHVGKIMIRPPRGSQASQWLSGSTSSPPQLFTITAGTGAVLDLTVNLTVTGDARSSNNSITVNGPANVGQVYWLALDNNAGGNLSTANVWSPMPELITIT